MKLTERIALQEFSYLEIEADSLDELINLSTAAKEAYADKLHKPRTEAIVHQEAQSTEAPPNLAQRANKSFGQASKKESYPCPECGQGAVTYKEGTSKKTGKPYAFWGCDRWREGCQYTSKFAPNDPGF